MTCNDCIHKPVCYRYGAVNVDYAEKCGDFLTVRQTGEWIRKHDSIVNAWFWECNKCECGFQQKYNFCPNCGCRMTGGLSKNSQQKQCLKQDLNKERHTGEWIPISERLPEERKSVLVYAPEYKNIYCAYLDGDTWFIFGGYGSYAVANVIAWMPLPEPYKEEGAE